MTDDGVIVNPRIQFRLDSLEEATVNALKGKKAGDVISFGADKFSARILEVYNIAEAKSQEAQAAEAQATADVATAQSADAQAAAAQAASPAPEVPTVSESPVDFAIAIHGEAQAQAASNENMLTASGT